MKTNKNINVVFSSTTRVAPIVTLAAPPPTTAPIGAKEVVMTPSSSCNLFITGVVNSWVPSPKILT
jgi:hypothetical protein